MPDFRNTARFNQIPVVGFVPYSGSTAPSSPVDGQFWYDTTNKLLKVYNSTTTTWVTAELGSGVIVDAMVSASAAIAESKLSLATDAAAGTGSRRTLGTGAAQAMPGNETLDAIAAANATAGDVSLNSHRVTNLLDPSGTGTQEAATANWVTAQINTATLGLDWKDEVQWATAAALASNTYNSGAKTLTATANGALSVDGGSPAVADRILVKNEATGSNNGIYTVTTAGDGSHAYVLTRTTDANTSALVEGGIVVPVTGGGTVNGGTLWINSTTGTVTLDTTALAFSQIGTLYTAGTGLTLTGSVFSLTIPVAVASGGTGSTTASGARGNLGAPGLFNSGAIGDGSSTVLTVTHNLNNAIPMVQVYDVSGAAPVRVECDITASTANAVQLTFATAPASNSIKCVVMG